MIEERHFAGYFSGRENGSDDVIIKSEVGLPRISRFLVAALNSPQYVKLIGSSRDGTIGQVVFNSEFLFDREKFNAYKEGREQFNGRNDRLNNGCVISRWDTVSNSRIILGVDHSYETYITEVGQYSYSDFRLKMDDGKLVKPAHFSSAYYGRDQEDYRGFVWLEGYEGPSVFNIVRTNAADRKAKVQAAQAQMKDALGQPVAVGDFIIANKGNDMFPAVVDEITKTGKSAYVKPCRPDAERVLVSYFYVINDQTKTAAMMRKLGAA